MNKKNKKNKSKPQNPVPPQDKNSSEIVETKPEVEEKAEERVPEIVSEVVSPESKESDNDNPKKPKRNRGKKKKEETSAEAKDEGQEIIESNPGAPVAPACRKKKGKPKPDQVPETTKDSVDNVDIVDSPKSPEPEEGKSKKKKKNKKRTDSERSEKTEEVSCTAAFQKILLPHEPRADKKDTKTDDKKEAKEPEPKIEESAKSELKAVETKSVKDVKTLPEPNKVEDSAKLDPKQVRQVDETPKAEPRQAETKAAIPVPPPPPPQEFLTKIQPVGEKSDSGDGFEEQKGKKKKKDKKYPKELEEQDLITALILGEAKVDVPSIFDKKLEARKAAERKQSARKEENKETASKDGTVTDVVSLKDIIEPDNTQSLKPEPENEEAPSIICKHDVIVLKYKEEEVAEVNKTEVQTEDKEKKNVILPKDAVTIEEQVIEETKVEESSPKTKAKIAKPVEKKGKNKQQAKTPEPLLDTTETKIDVKPEIKLEEKNKLNETETITPEQPVQLQKPTEIITAVILQETKSDDKQPSADEIIKQILEESISMETKAQTTKPVDDKKDTLDTEKAETVKKHGKSPKPQRKGGKNDKPVTLEPTETKIEPKSETTKEPADVTKELLLETKVDPEKTFAPIPDEISLSDIEKDVSFASDITPDQIEPPRSASEQLLDPNNNTSIQEIATTTLGVTVTTPDTPFITRSDQPLRVEMSAGVIVAEVESPVPKNEKTDLKSKVIEVNEDMEELRLSIERSLAEFNALEKEEIGLKKRDDLIIVTCAKVETEVESEPLVIDTTKLAKIDEVQEKSPDVQSDELMKALIKTAKSEEQEKVPTPEPSDVPIAPQRKENKGKNKSKKKGKQETAQAPTQSETTATQESKDSSNTQETKSENKSDKPEKSDTKEEGKKQSDADTKTTEPDSVKDDTAPIENFEDAMTSSVSVDVNQTFEILANACEDETSTDTKEQVKESPLSQPKNLLGHPDIPAPSNKTDYKKERNKPPNTKQARVKIKDSVDIEKTKSNKECQTLGKPRYGRNKTINESVTCVTNENEEYVYKYSFRKVFLSNICHVCKNDLKGNRVPCSFCFLIFYCSEKHREEDVAQHSDLCFAISTIAHLKGQKHIYADAAGTSGHSYRLLRMQAIISAEKILKRRLDPWEQEALLYPRVCAEPSCREWRQGALADCAGCGQVSFCSSNPEHLPRIHARWCKSYSLYQKLVIHQLTRGRLEPKLPNKVLTRDRITDNINRLLAELYDEKIDMSDIQYASLTQLATAPLTAAYAHQLYRAKLPAADTDKQSSFTIHVVGAELQFEADSLSKWERCGLHLRPQLEELVVVLVGAELNPQNLPLDLLGKVKLCASCRVERRRLSFRFHDNMHYHTYCESEDYIAPDIVCAFNPSIHRSTNYIRNDSWSPTINCILRSKKPFLITSYTMTELQRDVATVKKCSEENFHLISEPKFNPFASVRPDRNFISDDEIPLLFKNYCYTVLVGAF